MTVKLIHTPPSVVRRTQTTADLLQSKGFSMKPGISDNQEWNHDAPSTVKLGDVTRIFITRTKEWRAYDAEGLVVARGTQLWELPSVL